MEITLIDYTSDKIRSNYWYSECNGNTTLYFLFGKQSYAFPLILVFK